MPMIYPDELKHWSHEAKSSELTKTIHGLQTISSIAILGGADNRAKIVSAVGCWTTLAVWLFNNKYTATADWSATT